MGGYWLIIIATLGLSWYAGWQLKKRFRNYSKIPTANGMSGKEVVEKMLYDHDIHDVGIMCVDGQLTDHYNPENRTINLSREVYHGRNIAAAAVAAHECGHAVQHAEAYSWLTMRSALVPITQFASSWVQWVLIAGILLISQFPSLLLIGIGLFAITTLFSIVTLPVEVDASRRALAWIRNENVSDSFSQSKAFDALKWASYTYFIAAISSLGTLLYYVMMYLGVSDD